MSGSSPANWDRVVGALKELYGQLNTVTVPAKRTRLWERIAEAQEAAGRAVDLEVMPALKPEEGTTYKQAYGDSARLARILAGGERAFGRYKPGSVDLPRIPRAARVQRAMWERYLASKDRAERAELLVHLHVVTVAACGTRAASVLDHARASELFLARQAGR